MKDLQELFESMGTDAFNNLAELVEKKSINPRNQQIIIDMISLVYCSEKGLDEIELTEEELNKVFEDFSLNVAFYANVIKGHMEIMNGRIMLTNGESASFKLTPEGIKHVESLISK